MELNLADADQPPQGLSWRENINAIDA